MAERNEHARALKDPVDRPDALQLRRECGDLQKPLRRIENFPRKRGVSGPYILGLDAAPLRRVDKGAFQIDARKCPAGKTAGQDRSDERREGPLVPENGRDKAPHSSFLQKSRGVQKLLVPGDPLKTPSAAAVHVHLDERGRDKGIRSMDEGRPLERRIGQVERRRQLVLRENMRNSPFSHRKGCMGHDRIGKNEVDSFDDIGVRAVVPSHVHLLCRVKGSV